MYLCGWTEYAQDQRHGILGSITHKHLVHMTTNVVYHVEASLDVCIGTSSPVAAADTYLLHLAAGYCLKLDHHDGLLTLVPAKLAAAVTALCRLLILLVCRP